MTAINIDADTAPVQIKSLDEFMNQYLPEAAQREKIEHQDIVDVSAKKLAQAVLASIMPSNRSH